MHNSQAGQIIRAWFDPEVRSFALSLAKGGPVNESKQLITWNHQNLLRLLNENLLLETGHMGQKKLSKEAPRLLTKAILILFDPFFYYSIEYERNFIEAMNRLTRQGLIGPDRNLFGQAFEAWLVQMYRQSDMARLEVIRKKALAPINAGMPADQMFAFFEALDYYTAQTLFYCQKGNGRANAKQVANILRISGVTADVLEKALQAGLLVYQDNFYRPGDYMGATAAFLREFFGFKKAAITRTLESAFTVELPRYLQEMP
ncbi:MAG TPA: hypothetical protein VNG90_01930 [Candidatus Acidoferrum sp.]|nr:hypothetical protein [Candidatus Acidoferrum sp.]